MAAKGFRASKFKHMIGREMQASECYGNVKPGVMGNSEAPTIKATSSLLVFAGPVPGTICVQPLSQKGAPPDERPVIFNDSSAICDFDLAPTIDGLIASSWEDGRVLLHRVPAEGLAGTVNTAEGELVGHDKRLLYCNFHPYASDVLLTSDSGKITKLWDVHALAEKATLPQHGGIVVNASWSLDGGLCATACKDKKLRIIDPRANAVTAEAASHQGAKSGRVAWLGRLDRIFTVGFGAAASREMALWDPRNMAKPAFTSSVEAGTSTLLPYVDEDLSLIYLGGKGDGQIKIFEATDSSVTSVTQYSSKDPQSGLVMLPKSKLDIMNCEIARFLKLVETKRVVIPIRFEVPRQASSVFQEDLYPPTWDRQATMSADDFFGGQNRVPNVIQLKP